MESEFFQYLTADGNEPVVDASAEMASINITDPEWVSVPEVKCREDVLHLYVNELGELTDVKNGVGEKQIGAYLVDNELATVPKQEECKQESEEEECTYLELKTVPVEAYSQILCGGVDGYTYVKTGQKCMESYRDEFGFYVSSLPDQCKEPVIQCPNNTVLDSEAEQFCSGDGDKCSERQTRHADSFEPTVDTKEMVDSKADSVSLMKLRLHRIISNSENIICQTTSSSEERLIDSKVTADRPMTDVPVRKKSCPMVSQIAATILDKWKSMRPLGVTGLGDLPKYSTTSMKAKLVSRPGSASSTARKVVGDKGQPKTSRALRALERRRESQLALQQLRQMSKPVFKRRSRSSGAHSTPT